MTYLGIGPYKPSDIGIFEGGGPGCPRGIIQHPYLIGSEETQHTYAVAELILETKYLEVDGRRLKVEQEVGLGSEGYQRVSYELPDGSVAFVDRADNSRQPIPEPNDGWVTTLGLHAYDDNSHLLRRSVVALSERTGTPGFIQYGVQNKAGLSTSIMVGVVHAPSEETFAPTFYLRAGSRFGYPPIAHIFTLNQRLYGIEPPDLSIVELEEQADIIERYFEKHHGRENWLFKRFIEERAEPLTSQTHIFYSDSEFRADFYYSGGYVRLKMPDGSSKSRNIQFDSLGTVPTVDLKRSPGVKSISELCYLDDHIRFKLNSTSFAVKPLVYSASSGWGDLDLAGDFINSAVAVLRATQFGANLRNIVQPFDVDSYTLSTQALCDY